MTIAQLASMPSEVSKIALYLTYVALNQFSFDLRKIIKNLKITKEEFLYSLKYLVDLNIAEIQIDEENCKIYIMYLKHSVDINIQKWGLNSIQLLNEIIFEWNPNAMAHVINQVYRPIGKYDESTMGKFFDPNVPLKPVELLDDVKVARTKSNERKKARKLKSEKAIALLTNFYSKLSEKVNVDLDDKLREKELKVAKEFVTYYPEFPIEVLIEAIDWMLNDPFWSKIVVSIQAFKKHFPRYLLATKKVKKVKNIFKLV